MSSTISCKPLRAYSHFVSLGLAARPYAHARMACAWACSTARAYEPARIPCACALRLRLRYAFAWLRLRITCDIRIAYHIHMQTATLVAVVALMMRVACHIRIANHNCNACHICIVI